MSELYVDPEGHFALRRDVRMVELWTVDPIRFMSSERPEWQQAEQGLVARLHAALRALEPMDGDVLSCVFAHPSRVERPDVENRLFTNAKEPGRASVAGARQPNPFAHLPRHIRFERVFGRVDAPLPLRAADHVYYRYGLGPPPDSWSAWAPERPPLAEWRNVPVTGVSDQVGWPIWLSLRDPSAKVSVFSTGPPIADDFGISVTLHACRPIQAVTVMESVIDGIVASFQRERDLAQAHAVADCLTRKNAKLRAVGHERIVAAQVNAPEVLAGAPWHVNSPGTWCQLAPADRWLVAGEVVVTPPTGRSGHELSGRLLLVTAARADVTARR